MSDHLSTANISSNNLLGKTIHEDDQQSTETHKSISHQVSQKSSELLLSLKPASNDIASNISEFNALDMKKATEKLLLTSKTLQSNATDLKLELGKLKLADLQGELAQLKVEKTELNETKMNNLKLMLANIKELAETEKRIKIIKDSRKGDFLPIWIYALLQNTNKLTEQCALKSNEISDLKKKIDVTLKKLNDIDKKIVTTCGKMKNIHKNNVNLAFEKVTKNREMKTMTAKDGST